MRPTPLAAFEGTDCIDQQTCNRRQLFLSEPRRLAKLLQLRAY
jgi:hypothetical protein